MKLVREAEGKKGRERRMKTVREKSERNKVKR